MTKSQLITFLEGELKQRRIQYAIATEEAYQFTYAQALRENCTLEQAHNIATTARNKVHESLVHRFLCIHETMLVLKRELKAEKTTDRDRLEELRISHKCRHDAGAKLIAKGAIDIHEARRMTAPYLALIEMFTTIGEEEKPELENQAQLFQKAS
jgi:hypothetical protein